MTVVPSDVWFEISKHVNDGFTWKSFISTCKIFYIATKPIHREKVDKLSNHLFTMLKKYPNKPWDWSVMTENKHLTAEIVQYFHDKPWNWELLTEDDTNMKPEEIIKLVDAYPDKPWDWEAVSTNEFFTKEHCRKYIDKSLDFRRMKNFDWSLVYENPSKSWSWYNLIERDDIPSDFIEKLSPYYASKYNLWNKLFEKLPWNVIAKYRNKYWDMHIVSMNDHLTWKIIEENIHENWDWKRLSWKL